MQINCKDKSQSKLLLIPEFITYLSKLAGNDKIYIQTNTPNLYSGLQNFFQNVIFTDQEQKNYHICFCSDFEEGTSKSLQFVFSEKELTNLPEYVIPLIKNESLGIFHSDINSAKLMLVKMFSEQDLAEKNILISAGPTAEDIDPVRFLTNRSSGKMGLALAEAAFVRGAIVNLVIGPNNLKIAKVLNVSPIRSAADMKETIHNNFSKSDVYIGSAAIADYTPETTIQQKLKKQKGGLQLKLKRTTDVLLSLSEKSKNQLLVGFSVETENVIQNSLRKLESKKLDMIVVNNPKESGSAFAGETNKVSILLKNGKMYNMPLMSKLELSHKILDFIKGLNP